MTQYNLRNPAVKRLMRETEELKHPTEEYYAHPLEDNLFEWHFTIRGPPNSEFEGGIYHGRISLPNEYPMKPPSIILLTPNGRFEINKKICLSISGHHPESWQPSWSIRTALLAIIGFLPTHGNGAIGSLDYTPAERKKLALKSQNWKCSECGLIKDCLISPEAKCSTKHDVQKAKSPIEPNIQVKESKTEHNVRVAGSSKNYVQELASTELNVQKLDTAIELSIRGVEAVSFFSDGENDTGSDISFAQDTHSDKIFSMENVSTNSLKDDCTDLPSVITAIENTPSIRQRNLVSCRLLAESEQSDNAISEQPAKANSLHNFVSLIMIWVISVILFILIVRRWLAYDSL